MENEHLCKPIIVTAEDGTFIKEYKSINDAAEAYGLSGAAIKYRATKGIVFNGQRFSLGEKKYHSDPEKYKWKRRKKIKERFKTLSYQTRYHVCLTPCPFKEAPKPMIGSSLCQSCSSFQGHDKEKQIVSCSRQYV